MCSTPSIEKCTKMANPTQRCWKRLKKTAGRCLKGFEKVTYLVRAWKHDEELRVHVQIERAREEVDEWRHEDDQRYSGGTRVENASVAFVDPTDADRHRGGGSRNPVDDGLGTEFTSSSLNGLQVSQSDRVEKRSLADHLTKGKSWSEIAELEGKCK